MDERVINWKQYGATDISPAALGITLLMGCALALLRRDRAALPVLIVACFVPVDLRLVVGGLDFTMMRILLLFGLLRVLLRGEHRRLDLDRVDAALLAWIASGALFYVLREASAEALIYQAGVAFDALATFFLFRTLIRNASDARRALAGLAVICVVTGGFMVLEHVTNRNFFAVLGGVSEAPIVRDGKIRAQGAFSHPIMAGSFGASCVATSAALLFSRQRLLGIAGLVGAFVVTFTASSSGAVISFGTALVALAIWPFRVHMRAIRWSIAIVLLILHLIREKPVWHLIGRLSDLMGGTGYYRYALIDAFFHNWREWILVGTQSTAHWGWGMQDLTNQFVYEGVQGGFVTLVAFITLLVLCFANVSIGMRQALRRRGLPAEERTQDEFLAWALGATLATHCMSWISVSFFGQMDILLYGLFAMLSSLSSPAFWREAVPSRRARMRKARSADGEQEIHVETGAPSEPAGASLGRDLLSRRS